MRNCFLVYATFPDSQLIPDELYLTKEGDWVFKIEDDSFTLSAPQANWRLVGEIQKIQDGDTYLKDGSFYTFDKYVTWVIDGLLEGTAFHTVKDQTQIRFMRKVPREKYLNDPVAVKAEIDHVVKKYGYSNLAVAPKSKNIWEDEAKISCRKTKR